MVQAVYYDGHSAQGIPVFLDVVQGRLTLQGEGVTSDVLFSSVRITEKLGSAPRHLHFAQGGHCEVRDHAGFEALLQSAGYKPKGLVSRLEEHWVYAALASVAMMVIAAIAFYLGLPTLAKYTAAHIPSEYVENIDHHFFDSLDGNLLQTSKLSVARRELLKSKFEALFTTSDKVRSNLEFRQSKVIGPNAFALPGNTIVVTDELIKLAAHDEEIYAVLAHEQGHVQGQHALRQMLQSSVIGMVVTWYFGDVSALLVAAPTVLLETRYSRDFEREADAFAARALRTNGIAPARLADMLEKLETVHREKTGDEKHGTRIADFFSTHPDTQERINFLRNAQ
ncbi:MAG: M48 family metallopeptidase [Gammaproteobacteria bacterium]|nr:M48 family metallopeptidase [Gammaproteobacteria bacterium]